MKTIEVNKQAQLMCVTTFERYYELMNYSYYFDSFEREKINKIYSHILN